MHPSAPSAARRNSRARLLLALLLAAGIFLTYLPVLDNGFVDYDDPGYVSGNPRIRVGFTWSGVTWAFTTYAMGNWHPLTWLSHMADFELFGMDPRGHHLTGALFHAANAALLFLLLDGMTGLLWPSAAVAALFGVHPLHVESVAWAASRKDVLSTLLWLLASGAYLRYVRRPGMRAYLSVGILLLLGLMAKPMLVTFPFTLLVLDWWPLGRLGLLRRGGEKGGSRRGIVCLVLEKVPLMALSAAFSAVALIAQKSVGAVRNVEYYPFLLRLDNAVVSYVRYLGKTLWPQGLAVMYPHPRHGLPAWKVAAAAAFLLGVSSICLLLARRRPYLAAGWLWYLGTLVPVIGLVQVGAEAMSDRYTYVPHIGLFLLLAWGARDLRLRFSRAGPALKAAVAAWLAVCSLLTWRQIGYWHDSISLLTHAVEVTGDNWQARVNLGLAYNKRGMVEEARAQFRQVLRLKPDYARSHAEAGVTRNLDGKLEAALAHETESANPGAAAACRRGQDLMSRGESEKAVEAYREALSLDPAYDYARYLLGNALALRGEVAGAVAEYEHLLQGNPGHWPAHNNLGAALFRLGRREEAKAHFEETLRLNPRSSDAHGNLGMLLVAEGRAHEAVRHLEEALRLEPGDTRAMVSYAEALAMLGRTAEAERWVRETLRLDPAHRRARDLRQRLDSGRQ